MQALQESITSLHDFLLCMQNNLTFEANLQLNGGFVALHNDSLIDSPVEPGDTVTYSWLVQEDNGPAEDDVSSIAYAYASNADATANLNAGLFGAVVINRQVNDCFKRSNIKLP